MERVNTWQSNPAAWHPWLYLVILLQSLDVLTTAIGLRLGLPESNPLMASVLFEHSELAMYGAKAVLVGVIIFAIAKLRQRYRVWPLLFTAAFWTALAVLNNTVAIAAVLN